MFLKTLEVQGFKSFPDKVKIEIGKGLTAVVGPNGSGKSNVSDAIRWVLGEQSVKSLRGGKMEDVIFSGTQKRRPMGYAEVTLAIDNSTHSFDMDAEEIRVTRKYYRSGESDYLINGQGVRLRDINELFMDTGLGRDGYSMIGQGKVDEIVNAKPLERRYIFEEAAGIAKYRYRKEEAAHKLEQAEENLLRLRDILAEKESRLAPLAEQSEKANRFLELDREKRKLEISLWVYKLEQLKQAVREQDNKILAARGEYDDCAARAEENESKVAAVYRRMEEILKEADGLRGEKQALEEQLAAFGAQAAVLKNDILHHEEQLERLAKEEEEIRNGGLDTEQRISENLRQQEAQKQKIAAQKEEQERLSAALEKLNEENSDTSDKMTELTQKINRLTGECSNARVLLAGFETTNQELTQRLSHIAEEKTVRAAQQKELLGQQNAVASLLEALNEKETGNKNQQDGTRTILANRQQKLEGLQKSWAEKQQEISKAEHRAAILQDMEKNMEGFAYSVKYLLRQAEGGRLHGIRGPVFRLLKSKSGFEVALETALGGALQNIVCTSEEDAKAAIRALKQGDGGRATFLPVETIHGQRLDVGQIEKLPGFLGLACDAVTYEKEYEQIVLALLGRIVLAADLDAATAMAKKAGYRFRVVTKDGQVVNAGGSLTGGSNAKNNGLISRLSEIERMKQQAAAAAEQLAEEQKKAAPLKEETDRLKATLTALEAERMTIREDRAKAEAEQTALLRESETLANTLAALEKEEKEDEKRCAALQQSRDESEKTVTGAEKTIAALEQEVEALSGNRADVKAKRTALFEALNAARLSVLELTKDAEALEAEHRRLLGQGTDNEEKLASLAGEKTGIEAKIAALRQEIDNGNQDEKQLRDAIDAKDRQVSDKLAERVTTEGEVNALQSAGKEAAARKEALTGELTRLEERRLGMEQESERLIAGLMDEYEISLTEANAQAEPLAHPEKTQKEVGSLKWQIRQLGNVNLSAIEEYKEVKESHAFLAAQVQDLEESKASLTKLIDELSETMKNLFSAEFARIGSHFSKIFAHLFGGGEAELTFTDPGDVLNSGIEIKAQPPGKLIRNLSSLSGGERALVAISIYFAMMKVRPAPFCVLDEVDAPLDDVNVNRLADYLVALGDKTQFISITHKRGTMEAADVLYGVTMQEQGVTKVLSLDVAGAMAALEKTKKS